MNNQFVSRCADAPIENPETITARLIGPNSSLVNRPVRRKSSKANRYEIQAAADSSRPAPARCLNCGDLSMSSQYHQAAVSTIIPERIRGVRQFRTKPLLVSGRLPTLGRYRMVLKFEAANSK